MDYRFYKTHNAQFFYGKKGKLLRTVKNGWGDVFRKGAIVYLNKRKKGLELTSRNRTNEGFIKSVIVKDVTCVELIIDSHAA